MSDVGFIAAGYAVTASVLTAYAISIRLRARRAGAATRTRGRGQ